MQQCGVRNIWAIVEPIHAPAQSACKIITAIAELLELATQPRFIYTHRWQRHNLLVWDNRFAIHRRRPFPADVRRYLVRTTVAGDTPTVPQ